MRPRALSNQQKENKGRDATLFPALPIEWKMAVFRANILQTIFLTPTGMLKECVLALPLPTSVPFCQRSAYRDTINRPKT